MIFFDTSAALALTDDDDPYHQQSIRTLDEIMSAGETVFTHNYILSESMALIQRRIGLAQALDFHATTHRLLTVHWITDVEHDIAVELLTRRNRRRLSLVDCVSFVLMETYGSTTAFAYDSDFQSEGFELIG